MVLAREPGQPALHAGWHCRLSSRLCCGYGACLHLTKNTDPLVFLPPFPCPFAGYDIVSWQATSQQGGAFGFKCPVPEHAAALTHAVITPAGRPAPARRQPHLPAPAHPLPGVQGITGGVEAFEEFQQKCECCGCLQAACGLQRAVAATTVRRRFFTNLLPTSRFKNQSFRTSTTRSTGRVLRQTPTHTGGQGMLPWGAWEG